MAKIYTATPEQQIASLQAQISNSDRQLSSMSGTSSDGGASVSNAMLSNGRLKDQLAQLQSSQKSAGASAGGDPAANRAKALGLTEGRGDATMNDPRITAALDMIQKQMGEGPYSAQVVNQQANRMADRTATTAGQTAQSLRDQMAARGGNPNDPSFQAAMRAADSGRMQQNNADRGDLESNATLQNYSAQNAAANQLANQRMSQLGQANGQYNQAAQLYAGEQFSGDHQNTYGSGSSSSSSSARGGLGYTPPTYGSSGNNFFAYNGDQQPQPSPQPKPAPNPVTRPAGYTDLMTGTHMYNGEPGYGPSSSGAGGTVTNWNNPNADHTQYDNAGDPSLPLPAARAKSVFTYKPPKSPYAQY